MIAAYDDDITGGEATRDALLVNAIRCWSRQLAVSEHSFPGEFVERGDVASSVRQARWSSSWVLDI